MNKAKIIRLQSELSTNYTPTFATISIYWQLWVILPHYSSGKSSGKSSGTKEKAPRADLTVCRWGLSVKGFYPKSGWCKYMHKVAKSNTLCKKSLFAIFVKNNHYIVQFVLFLAHLTIILCNYCTIMSFKTPKTMSKWALYDQLFRHYLVCKNILDCSSCEGRNQPIGLLNVQNIILID